MVCPRSNRAIVLIPYVCSPWVIIDDIGGAFAMGAIGGGLWHAAKGAKNSPRVRYYDHACAYDGFMRVA